MKRFYGGSFIEKELLKEEGINYPIKLEYYKQINEEIKGNYKYGITVVQTEYAPENLIVETKDLDSITNDENTINRILNLFKDNKVTAIHSEDIIEDLQKTIFENELKNSKFL